MNKQPSNLKNIRYSFFLLGVLLLIISHFSCKKFVQIPPPQTQLVTTNVFANNSTATAALLNIYTLIWTNDDTYGTAQALGLYSDELTNYSASTSQIQLYTNSLQALTPATNTWANAYKYIYASNAVIEGLKNTSGCSPAVKRQLSGEAYFLRAFWHFNLTNIYGDVPIILTTDYTINNTVTRSARVQVLQQVVKDLQNAQSLLNPNYVDGSDTIATALRVRPNQTAATALLARAYLYLADYSNQNIGYYQKADSAATAVINNSNYTLAPLSGVFATTSKEAIWQIQTPSSANENTWEGQYFILTGAPSTSGAGNVTAISPQLLSAFESGDQRLTNWIGSYTTATLPKVTYYYSYKYKGNSANYSATNIPEYDTPIRLGETYLIRAEAQAHEGNINGALADLSIIRMRAGLTGYNGATDQVSLLRAILHERQVELFTEWGHRWFDLCRTTTGGTSNAALLLGPPGNVCQAKNGIWYSDNHQLLFPIPQTDRTNNSNLSQNPGY